MKKWKWPVVMLAQFALALVAGTLIAAADLLPPWVYGILSWAGMSAVGMTLAYRATRRGLLNYAAWIVPPACMWLGHWLLWGYSPDPGPVLLSALISLVGAAAGEVRNQQSK